MAKPKPRIDEGSYVAVRADQRTRQALSTEEVANAICEHVEHSSPTLHLSCDVETKRHQLLVETLHVARNGQKFRIVTRYDAAETLVELVDATNAH